MKTNEELIEQGKRAFQMIIEPVNVPFKTDHERKLFMLGYDKAKQAFWEKNRKVVRYDRD